MGLDVQTSAWDEKKKTCASRALVAASSGSTSHPTAPKIRRFIKFSSYLPVTRTARIETTRPAALTTLPFLSLSFSPHPLTPFFPQPARTWP